MNKYSMFTAKEIKPLGWLRRQLEIQADGLSGNLDKIWPDVRDSKWIGGNCEGWERVPYWLDGFIPLAYLLDSDDMKERAKKYIDAILGNQAEDGWICPCSAEEIPRYDTWAVQLIAKVLVVYYECSGDERIPGAVFRLLKNYYTLLKSETIRLFDWGRFRWFETFVSLNWLYARYPEDWIRELAGILRDQGADYNAYTELWKVPLNKWTFETHIVNVCMMLKYEAISCDLLGEEYRDRAEELLKILERYNGTSVGLFTGDECLAGLSPVRGTELCAVVEEMYSYELLYAYTGENRWMERLETVAFNALPATISDDMWTHQYDQMSNQIACIRFPSNPIFGTNYGDAHLFGLEPNYGCCTANFNQGWPKLALSALMQKDHEIICALPVPVRLDTEIDGQKVTVELETEYPFRNTFRYRVRADRPVRFALRIRIPSFAKQIRVDGKAVPQQDQLTFEREWTGEQDIHICFEAEPKLIRRPNGLHSLKYGSLVFSVPIRYRRKMHEYTSGVTERKFPYCDYELIPESDWNYGFEGKEFTVSEKEGDEYPFSSEHPRVVIRATMRHVPWDMEERFEWVCARRPKSHVGVGEAETVTLYPYGCAKLRMTEMPVVRKK